MAREPRTRTPRLDQPREARRALISRPQVDPEAFGRLSERFARFMGTAQFLIYMTLFVAFWVVWNIVAPESVKFDDYPFGLLGILLAIEAIFITGFVLIAQNRQAAHADLRAQLDYEVNVRTYREIHEIKAMLQRLHEELAERRQS